MGRRGATCEACRLVTTGRGGTCMLPRRLAMPCCVRAGRRYHPLPPAFSVALRCVARADRSRRDPCCLDRVVALIWRLADTLFELWPLKCLFSVLEGRAPSTADPPPTGCQAARSLRLSQGHFRSPAAAGPAPASHPACRVPVPPNVRSCHRGRRYRLHQSPPGHPSLHHIASSSPRPSSSAQCANKV